MRRIIQEKWLLIILATLLVVNIGFVYYHMSGKWQHKSRPSMSDRFYGDLGLTEAQKTVFRQSKDTFMKSMRPVWDEIRKSKRALYEEIGSGQLSDSAIHALTASIAEKSRIADERLFLHFRSLRTLCTPVQQQGFDTLVPRLVIRNGSRSHSSAGSNQ